MKGIMGSVTKRIVRGLLYLIVFLFSNLFCFSQQYVVKGKVNSTDKSRIESYNIMVLQDGNSPDNVKDYEFEKQDFSINLDALPSTLLITSTGYKDTVVYVATSQDELNIILRKSQIDLSEVVVKGILPVFHNRKDKMEVQVANTTLSETGTAMDILQKSPKIKVDENYGVYLGLDQATIYIDGRQIPSSRALEMMSSRDIEKIDLITNPSVKYDSNANVIIEVISKRGKNTTGKNLDIDLTGRMTKGEYWRQFAQAGIRYSYSKFSVYGSFSLAPEKKMYKEMYSRNMVYNSYNAFVVNDFNTNYDTDRNNRALIGTSYQINNEHSIGIEAGIQTQKGDKDALHANIVYQNQDSETPLFTINTPDSSSYNRINRTANLYHVFKSKSGYSQKTIVDIYNFKDDSKQELGRLSSKNRATNNLFAIRSDVSVPFGKKVRLDTGAKYQYRRNRNEDEVSSNLYKYDDKSAALYAMGSFSSGKFKIETGLRLEYVDNITRSEFFDQDTTRWSLVPNIALNYKVNEKVNLDLVYTQNIQRPSFEQQNPAVTFIDPDFYKTGNPALKDERRHNFSLKANYDQKSLSLNYIRRNNAITWVMDRDPKDPAKTRSTQMNVKRAEIYSLDAVIPYRSDPFNVFVSTGLIHSKINSEGSEISMKQTLWYATANLDFNLPFGIKFNTNHRYFTKGLMYVFYFKPSYRADISLKRTFLKDKLSAVLIWNDIFKTDKMKTYTDMNNNPVTYNYSYDQSTISLSVTYNLNF